jgi:tRNA-splicing ligase RtcB
MIFYDYLKCDFGDIISIHHNYANLEQHFGEQLWIHRKGAISARDGELGIVPGSQGSHSYIVRGQGNPMSFMSSSHGAGRVMSRRAAVKKLNLDEVKKNLDEKGIIHSVYKPRDLDEAPQCYKDIDEVMEQQKDLTKPIYKLYPLAVVKG